jgi:TetR/AcrR family transcriptional regulator, transcriptional repressor for nem operon
MSDTREFIVDQAYSLFLHHSYEAVSISEISKAIGFTKGALYHHFKNKEELFKSVIDKYLIISGLTLTSMNVSFAAFIEETLKKASETMFGIMGEESSFIPIDYISLLADAFRHYPGFANEKAHMINDEIERIKIVMDQAIRNGELRPDINTSVLAISYFSLTVGLASSVIGKNTPQQAIDSLRDQLYEFYKVLKA